MIARKVSFMSAAILIVVFAPGEMKAQHGDAPLVDDVRINLAVAQLVRDHLAATFHADEASVFLAAGLLERAAVTLNLLQHSVEHPDTRHVASAVDLDMVAAEEFVCPVVFPPRGINVNRPGAVMVMGRKLGKLRKISDHAARGCLHQVAADDAGGIGEAVGKQRGL
jgi:hypothetical protein